MQPPIKEQNRGKHDFMVMLDAGHGSLDRKGKYTTAIDKGKYFDHKNKDLNFHGIQGNSVFYEGVFNRIMANKIRVELAQKGIFSAATYDAVLDTPIGERTGRANKFHAALNNKTVFGSIHSNASGVNASGWEIYTSVGATQSDVLVDFIAKRVAPIFEKWSIPPHGNPIKEKNFTVLTDTNSPAFLIEIGYFDNLKDAQIIDKDDFQTELSEAIALGIDDYFETVEK